MKRIFQTAVLAIMVSTVAVSCKKKADAAPADTTTTTETTQTTTTAPTTNTVTTTTVDQSGNLQKVKDAVKDFPSVQASVENGTLTLKGTVSSPEDAMKIKQSVDALNLGKVDNQIQVKH